MGKALLSLHNCVSLIYIQGYNDLDLNPSFNIFVVNHVVYISLQEAHGQLDLCQHLSRVTVNQPSIDNMGEAPPGATPTAPIANNPYILGAATQPHPNLQPGFSQQHPNQVVQASCQFRA